jgi:hypothetical protein
MLKLWRIVSGLSFFVLTGLVITFYILASKSNSSLITFSDMEKESGVPYFTGAVIMSVPLGGDGNNFYNTEYLEFPPAGIILSEGESAYLQFSVVRDKKQFDLPIPYLYDADIIKIDTEKNRAKITALKEGECAVQTFDSDNIRDVAFVRVIKKAER